MLEIRKRNGEVVPFRAEKITTAMQKAFAAAHGAAPQELLDGITAGIVSELTSEFPEQVPSVEHVQDKVEMALMKAGHLEVAKAYIVYRYEHTKIREAVQEEVLEKIEEKKLTVTTRSGRTEAYDEAKVRAAFTPFIQGYEDIADVDAIMTQLKYELYDGIKTSDVMRGLTMVVRSLIERDPAYSKIAARLLLDRLYGEVFGEGYDEAHLKAEHARVFERNMKDLVAKGDLDERMAGFDFKKLGDALIIENDLLFEYMGLEIMSSRYCMEDPKAKKPLETPQMLWMRVAMGLAIAEKPQDRERVALEFYDSLSNFYYTPGGRTLFQAGAKKAQLSNCFLNSVPDSLDGIFKSISDNAQYLKWSGGTGTDWTK